MGYDPSQPRHPAGTGDGGKWSGGSSSTNNVTVSKGDWGTGKPVAVIGNDDPKAIGRAISDALKAEPPNRHESPRTPERFEKAAKNWQKEFEGRVITDPVKIAQLKEAVAENHANPLYMEIVRAHGSEGVIVLAEDTADAEKLIGGGHAAQRLGVVTAVLIKTGSKINSWDEHTKRTGTGKPTPGISASSEAGGLPATLRHEFGHAVHARIQARDNDNTDRELREKFEAMKNPKEELTYYAGFSGHREGFPEALSIGTDPKYNPADWSPAARAYIEAVVTAARRRQ